MLKEAKKVNNESLNIYNIENVVIGNFEFAGYLDYTNRNFPSFKNKSTNSDFVPYIMISEQGFAKLGFNKLISDYSINVEDGKEKEVFNQLKLYAEKEYRI